MQALKNHAFCVLAARRPLAYGGDGLPDWKLRRRSLKSLPPPTHDASTLLRIWMGVPLTRDRRARILQGTTNECRVWTHGTNTRSPTLRLRCLLRERPHHLAWLNDQHKRASTHALMCMRGQGMNYISAWKQICRWGILCPTEDPKEHDATDMCEDDDAGSVTNLPGFPLDKKGYFICLDRDTSYTYCARCFVSRRGRDWKFVHSSP